MIKIKMTPHPGDYSKYDNGIAQVVVNWNNHCKESGFEIVQKESDTYDLRVSHAGITGKECDVAILHGMYFTADYVANNYEYKANANIVEAIRYARRITVPSTWVSEIIKRDLHKVPSVVPHGINSEEWKHNFEHENYVLWAKNRPTDVCTTKHLFELSRIFPKINFVSTFPTDPNNSNVKVIGIKPHSDMKSIIQKSGVYLSSTKETFGIATLEAMACFPHNTNVEVFDIDRIMRKRYSGKLIKIKTDRTTIEVTPDHPFFTNAGWVLAKDLTKDTLLCYSSSYRRIKNARKKEIYSGTIGEIFDTISNNVNGRTIETRGDKQIHDERIISLLWYKKAIKKLYSTISMFINTKSVSLFGRNSRWGRDYNYKKEWKEDESYDTNIQHINGIDELSLEYNKKSWMLYYHKILSKIKKSASILFSNSGDDKSPIISIVARLFGNKTSSYGIIDRMDKSETESDKMRSIYTEAYGYTTRNKIFEFETIKEIDELNVDNIFVYNFTTKSSTYLAEGYVVHNCGVPILGFRYGGNIDLVEHGVNGYLAEPGNYDDLATGLDYCIKYRETLGNNGIELAKKWTWKNALDILCDVFKLAIEDNSYIPSVTCVIPTYNYASMIPRAIESVRNQEFRVEEIIVVDDGSTDNTEDIVISLMPISKIPIRYIKQNNSGVANARNRGVSEAKTKYVFCLDPDDAIEPLFTRVCVEGLEANKSLGIAYTGLQWIKKDGTTGISEWPGEWNFDDQLKRKNQIPTCCVFVKEMWDSLGGQRQRYAPNGAGSEDADFWTRAGSYGWGAKKVTDLPLFIYSWGTGMVSGNKDYREVDWLSWSPWVKDNQHPLSSYATPQKISHPVRQYDQPIISVIIPVGPGHENSVFDAIDSLEAQVFRKWECIVVWDSDKAVPESMLKAYPFVGLLYTQSPRSGPGVARNIGAKNSRGNFLVFLDADDYLLPDALITFVQAWNRSESVVYSDYLGKAVIDPGEIKNLGKRLIDFRVRTNEALLMHSASKYDCELAQNQPDKSLYHWCLVTCLIPKAWHNDIGGFDESMKTFEDVDYHWRMARAGYCYSHIDIPLIVYNFSSGNRRESATFYTEKGRLNAQSMLKYMSDKYKGINKMPCKTCGGGHVNSNPYVPKEQNTSGVMSAAEREKSMIDSDFVECKYIHPNLGEHRVVGGTTNIDYGYRAGGDTFLVNIKDVVSAPHLFQRVVKNQVSVPQTPSEPIKVPEPIRSTKVVEQPFRSLTQSINVGTKEPAIPVVEENNTVTTVTVSQEKTYLYNDLTKITDLQLLPGVTETIEKNLNEIGVFNAKDVVDLGFEELQKVKYIGEKRASLILESIKKLQNG